MTAKTPTEIDAAAGATVKARRVAMGVSQETLAKAIGVSFQQLGKYESGRNRLSIGRLVSVASALGCRAADLLPAEAA